MKQSALQQINADALQMIRAGLHKAPGESANRARMEAHGINVPAEIDVQALRKRMKLSQRAFAARYGFTVARVRDWEQMRRQPDGGVRAYLTVIDRDPEAVERALSTP